MATTVPSRTRTRTRSLAGIASSTSPARSRRSLVTADGRPLDGDTGASRPALFVMPGRVGHPRLRRDQGPRHPARRRARRRGRRGSSRAGRLREERRLPLLQVQSAGSGQCRQRREPARPGRRREPDPHLLPGRGRRGVRATSTSTRPKTAGVCGSSPSPRAGWETRAPRLWSSTSRGARAAASPRTSSRSALWFRKTDASNANPYRFEILQRYSTGSDYHATPT